MKQRPLALLSTTTLIAVASAVLVLAACAGTPSAPPFSQAGLPGAVQVPAGHVVALETVGRGEVTYECRAPASAAGPAAWVFAGPKATLTDRQGRTVGRYFGPPATWEASDGSAITGNQLAVAPAAAGNLPLQLVAANPASRAGAMRGISHIQRVATQGGVAPASGCAADTLGKRQVVTYQADYIFWKAM